MAGYSGFNTPRMRLSRTLGTSVVLMSTRLIVAMAAAMRHHHHGMRLFQRRDVVSFFLGALFASEEKCAGFGHGCGLSDCRSPPVLRL